jgi:hypothetical protein
MMLPTIAGARRMLPLMRFGDSHALRPVVGGARALTTPCC